MKPTTRIIQSNLSHASRLRGRHRNRALATAFMTALASAAAPLAQATQLTWSGGGGNTNWSTGTNWAGTAPTGSSDSLIFAGNTNLITNNDITGLTLVAGTSPTSAIAFTNTSNVTGGAFTLGGNAITLGGSITTTAVTTGTLVDTISLQLNLIAGRTITTATNHGLIISGLINDTSGTNSAGITKSGGATLQLSNDSNNFTALSIQQGTLTATSIAASGTASAIGRGSSISMGNTSTEGILNFTGTNSAMASTNRTISLADSSVGARINNNGTVALLFSGSFAALGSTSRTMTFGGTNTGANDFQNTMVNPTGGVLTVTKLDGGTWTLSGANTYTGQTNINNGTLNVATIADSGSSNLGLGTLIRIGNTSTNGILNYTGTGSTTSRTVQIGNNSGTPATGDTGGATINSNGTGALVFTAANFNTTGLTGSVATSRTLTLGGANTGANEIKGVIADGLSGTMTTSLAKAGDGTWILSGANTYTGTTTINAGTLKLGTSNVLPNTAVTIGATGAATTSTLELNGFSETIGSLSVGRTTTTVAGAMANVVNNGGGSPVLTLGGALTYNAGSVGFLNGQATISASLNTGGAGRTIAVGDGGAAVDLVISGAISGAGNLTKTGAGVLQLSGANSNTGNLIIQDSMVKLGASNVLTDSTSINVGNASSTAGATFDLNGFSDTVTSVTLGATATAAGFTHSIINTGGSGVLTLGGTLTYNAGGANLNGQATISADLATGTATRSFAVGDGSATDDLVITGALQAGGGFNLNGGGTMRLDNAGNNHATSQISGGSTLKLGANSVLGTTTVNLAQAVAGTSTLDLNGKTDAVGTTLSLSNTTTTALGAVNQIIDSAGGGVLQLNGAVTYNAGSATFNNGTTTISASLDLNGALRSFNINDSDQVAQDVVISGVIKNSTGTAGLTKNNAGTLVLSGANTYNGNTTVNAGTLALGATGTIANSANIIVGDAGSSGAMLDVSAKTGGFTIGAAQTLKGIGTVDANNGINKYTVTIEGTHAAGNSIGKQTIDGNLSYAADSIFAWELGSNVDNNNNVRGTGFDAVDISGDLAINESSGSGAVFKIMLGTDFDGSDSFWDASHSWDVFNVAGSSSTVFSTFQLFNSSNPASQVTNYSTYGTFTYNFGSGTGTLSWSAVPESTSALTGLLIGAGLLRRRRGC